MTRLHMLAARQATARRARLENVQHGRHMIGQYDAVEIMGALTAIRDREQRTGKFGGTAEELNALHALVETSADFWPRQPAELYRLAVEANATQAKRKVRERGAV